MLEVYSRPNSPYWYYKVPVLDDDGHVISYERGSTKRKDKGEARKVAKAIAKKIQDRDQLGIRESGSIADAAMMYINELEATNKPSVKDARTFLSKLSSKSRGSEPISRLNKHWLAKLKASRLQDGLSPRYINNELTFWISVFMKARDDYNMAVDLSTNFKKLKLTVNQKTRYLMADEEKRLLAELHPERDIKG